MKIVKEATPDSFVHRQLRSKSIILDCQHYIRDYDIHVLYKYLPVNTQLNMLQAFYSYIKILLEPLECSVTISNHDTLIDCIVDTEVCIRLTKKQYHDQFTNMYTIGDSNCTYDTYQEFLEDSWHNLDDYITERKKALKDTSQDYYSLFKAIEADNPPIDSAITDEELLEALYNA